MNNKDTCLSFGFRYDLPKWQQLVAPAWVARLIAGESVPAPPANNWRLLEIGFDTMDAYLQGHILGARYVDTTEFECEPLWNKVVDTVLLKLLLILQLEINLRHCFH